MNRKKVVCAGLTMRDFLSFEEKIVEAVKLFEHAVKQGADLVVFPESINLFRGDGCNHPNPLPIQEAAVRDFTAVRPLIDAARTHHVAVVIPLFKYEGEKLYNSAYFFDENGGLIGSYRKIYPTDGELEQGVTPGAMDQELIHWGGLVIGGAICFDTNFEEVFASQAARGANFFIVPSLWPGGTALNCYALKYSAPMALAYPAWSRIIDIDGGELASGGERNETIRFGYGTALVGADINFDRKTFHLASFADHWREIERQYGDSVKLVFDQPNCLVYLESLTSHFSVADIAEKFKLRTYSEFLDDYRKNYQKYKPVK